MRSAALDVAPAPAMPTRPAPRPARRQALQLFIPRRRFTVAAVIALAATLIAAPFYDTPYLAAGMWVSVFVAAHGLVAARRLPWIPGMIAFVAGIQWVLSSWAAYHLPSLPLIMRMSLGPADYFAFAVPTFVAFVAGLYLPLMKLGQRPAPAPVRGGVTPGLKHLCTAMLFGGIVMRLVIVPICPDSLRGVCYMLSDLQYVGVFTLLMAREPGWRWRLAVVLLAEAYSDSAAAQYISIVLWASYAAILLVYTHRVKTWKLIVGMVCGAVAITVINAAKAAVRAQLRQDPSTTLQTDDRAALAASEASEAISTPDKLFSLDNVAWNVARLNQGAITSRVLYWTPEHEPYAHGETITTALYAALVPRAFDPDKYVAGGMANYPRFTGLELFPGTSINLSIPGEIYANFGTFGAVIGCFVYGAMLAFLFRMFLRLSRQSVLWWAWAPYVLLSTMIAESGLGETLNQISKTLLIMWAITTFIPAWSQLRGKRSSRLPRLRPSEPLAPAVAATALAPDAVN